LPAHRKQRSIAIIKIALQTGIETIKPVVSALLFTTSLDRKNCLYGHRWSLIQFGPKHGISVRKVKLGATAGGVPGSPTPPGIAF